MTPQFTINPLTGQLVASNPTAQPGVLNPMTGLPYSLQQATPQTPQGAQQGNGAVGQGNVGAVAPAGPSIGTAPATGLTPGSGVGGTTVGGGGFNGAMSGISNAMNNAGTPMGGMVNLGPTGAFGLTAGGLALGGPIGAAAGLFGAGSRAYNAATASAQNEDMGLPGLSTLQTIGAVLGANGYGSLSGNAGLNAANANGYNNDAYGSLAGSYKGDMLGDIASGKFAPTAAQAGQAAAIADMGGSVSPGADDGADSPGT